MGLFSKKPGGTFFGNLLRGVGQSISNSVGMPGLLGSGANMLPATSNAPAPAPSVTSATLPASTSSEVLGGGGNNNILLIGGAALAALLLLKRR